MSRKGQTIAGAEKVITTFEQSAKSKKIQPPTSAAEKAEREAAGNTQGRTGCHKPRINFAFTTSNYEFVKRFSKCKGQNMTDFINSIIESYQKEHQKELEEIERILTKL